MTGRDKRTNNKPNITGQNKPSKPRKKVVQRLKQNSIAPPTPGIEPSGKQFSLKTAAAYLNICPNTLLRRCNDALIVFFVTGNAYLFYEVHLIDYLKRCMRNGY